MPLEIERKFLISSATYRDNAQSSQIRQVYLSVGEKMAIRVRIDGMQASLAIKYKLSERVNREYEYSIPIDEARSLMNLDNQLPFISKTRYMVENEGHTWEVDEFHADNEGLIVAEIELDDENETFKIPPWLGEEVTSDYRYLNSNLAVMPYTKWKNII